jgi:hypothetical protein
MACKCGSSKTHRVVVQVQLLKEREGGGFAEIGDQKLPLAAFLCDDCGLVEFYISPARHKEEPKLGGRRM